MPNRPSTRQEREQSLARERSQGYFWKNVLALMVRVYGPIRIAGPEAESLGSDELDVKTIGNPSKGIVVVGLANGKRTLLGRARAAWRTLCEAS